MLCRAASTILMGFTAALLLLWQVVVVSSTPAGVGVVGTLQETETSVSNREAPAARHLAGKSARNLGPPCCRLYSSWT